MKIIVFTDIHGKINMVKRYGEELKQADFILLAGDITHFGDQDEARAVIDAIKPYCDKILAVPGNCDNPGVEQYLEYEGINLHGKAVQHENIMFAGIGGSLPCPGVTPNELSEAEIENILFSVTKKVESHPVFVFVSHQPPLNTKNDAVRHNHHVGSISIRRFIQKHQPLICFTGHIHEGVGIDHIGLTKIVNPGPFFTGAFVLTQIGAELEYLEIKKFV